MSDTANFDTDEKVNFLFKKDMGFSSTNESIPWFQETNVIVNDYFLSKNLLVSDIPISPNFNIDVSASDVNLSDSNFATNSNDYGVKEDSTRTVRKYTKIILEAVPNSSNNAYYKLDDNNNNVLADALQFNTNWDLVSSKPYGYILTNQSNINISPNSPDEILQNSTGGNWIFDIKNGIIFFPDYSSSIVNNTNNKPVLTFYKYIGQKGGKFENNSDNSFNNIDISGLIIAKGLNEQVQEKLLYYNTTTGEVTYHNNSSSGGGIIPGSDLSLGNIDLSGTLNANAINLSGDIIPVHNTEFDIGSATKQIKDLYLSSTLFMGTDTPGLVKPILTVSGGRAEFTGAVNAPSDISTNSKFDELEVSGNVTFTNSDSKFNVFADVSFNKNLDVSNNLKVNGSITGGSIVIGSANISETELEVLDGVTPGSAVVSKALVVDSNKDITGIRNISFTSNILPENNSAILPVSFSSCILKTTGLNNDLSGTNTNWTDASGFELSKTLQSQYSYVRIEIRANYIASFAANRTISFRVLRSIDGGLNYDKENPVFEDLNLGTKFGIGEKNIYTGLYIDSPNNTNLSYKLQFKREALNVLIPYGIQSGGNYMFLQEIYRPNS